jgi:hypothetical protein
MAFQKISTYKNHFIEIEKEEDWFNWQVTDKNETIVCDIDNEIYFPCDTQKEAYEAAKSALDDYLDNN